MPPTPSPTYERLRDYIARRMHMSHVYQPLMLKERLAAAIWFWRRHGDGWGLFPTSSTPVTADAPNLLSHSPAPDAHGAATALSAALREWKAWQRDLQSL